MSALLAFITTWLLPFVLLWLPGIALVPGSLNSSQRLGRVMLWSLTTTILAAFIIAQAQVPVWFTAGLWPLALGFWLWRRPHVTRRNLATIALLLAAYTLLALPLLPHAYLPTGDIQKSIIWAQEILRTNALPQYHTAPAWLNRDPVDFYTPALHAVTAFVLKLAPHPLTAAALTAASLSLALGVIAVAAARLLMPRLPAVPVTLLTALFLFTQLRFLRYLREPGYHYQNLVGEVLLFGSLWLVLSLLKRWRWPDAVLLGLSLITLLLTHQFSAFLAAFVLAIPLLLLGHTLIHRYRWRPASLGMAAVALALIAGGGIALDLHTKVDDIFTAEPHLLDLNPTMFDYPRLMGPVWLALGLGGWLFLVIRTRRQPNPLLVGWLAAVAVLLALSQGPRLFIDIPPVRTLFYLAVPLSVCAALWLAQLWHRAPNRRLLAGALLALLLVSSSTTLAEALTVTHSVRTNSTLLLSHLELISYLTNSTATGGILVDDYNRRSSSWLVLSGRSMYTRIAADLERQMNEAKQSPLREQLYLNQLAYEKIFSLASQPFLTTLLDQHAIAWVTGIDRSSTAGFAANPALQPAATADDITLFTRRDATCAASFSASEQAWLLRTSTLANDIGDDEDAFAHLPASLRTTRLSSSHIESCRTTRTSTAPLIPLVFNVGDYVAVLWDQEQTDTADTTLEALIRFDAASPLTLRTATGFTIPVTPKASLIRLPASAAPLDDRGFVTLLLENPDQIPVTFDLIALGLARVP